MYLFLFFLIWFFLLFCFLQTDPSCTSLDHRNTFPVKWKIITTYHQAWSPTTSHLPSHLETGRRTCHLACPVTFNMTQTQQLFHLALFYLRYHWGWRCESCAVVSFSNSWISQLKKYDVLSSQKGLKKMSLGMSGHFWHDTNTTSFPPCIVLLVIPLRMTMWILCCCFC